MRDCSANAGVSHGTARGRHPPPRRPPAGSGSGRGAAVAPPSLHPAPAGLLRRQALLSAPWLLLLSERAAGASPASDIQAQYDRYAPTYEALDGGAASDALGFPELRRALTAQAHGAVLEVGVGTGLNLPLYEWERVSELTAVDLSSGMLAQAQARAAAQLPSRPLRFVQADATALPFSSGSFDVAVDTFSLCVFPQPEAALAELARVLRPGGSALLLEHTRSPNPLLGAYQDLTASAVAATSKGCVWNQDVPGMVEAAGLRVTGQQRHLGGLVTTLVAVKPP